MDSTLKLIIEKGPREGETLEFSSRSVIRIGRLLRGNTIAIKDAGISSKHLSIKFVPEKSQWLLSDLDSSNGTFLNDNQLSTTAPADLTDGDTIKLGELTSIKVQIESNIESQVRRNPRRGRGKQETAIPELEVGDDGVEKDKAVGKPPRRGRAKKDVILDEIPESSCDPKRGRGKPEKAIPELGVGDNEEEKNQAVGKPPRRGRLKKVVNLNEILERSCVVAVKVEEISNVAPVSENPGRHTRSTRNSKKVENAGLSMNESNLKEPERAVPAQWSGRRKRILQDDQASENLDEERAELLARMGNLGHENFKKNSPVKENLEAEQLMNFGEECSKDKENSVDLPSKAVEIDVSGEKGDKMLNLGEKGVEELATTSGVKDNCGYVEEYPDLEKMTLGDWFDYLEVNLPKEIYDETEEMILGMRKKADQFKEFMLQQKNARA